jgi:hypothetical protein
VVATGDVHLLDSAEVASSDPGASAALGSQPTTLMDALAFTAAELDLLRALARCCGTYVGPGSPPTWLAAPRITFDGGTRLPAGGLVFVDTRSGINPTASTETADLAEVTVGHDAALAATAGFRGWLIVNGNLRWQSSASAGGLVYAQAGLTWSGEGALAGNVVVSNVTGASAAVEIGPSASIAFDCGAARSGGGTVPSGWFVKPGSYREVSD